MITWYYGNTGAGKTTQARKHKNCVLLDGDELRECFNNYDLSEEGRRKSNIDTARLAKLIENQGLDVVVAKICPYRDLREEVQLITGCEFIYMSYNGDDKIKDSPFERPI